MSTTTTEQNATPTIPVAELSADQRKQAAQKIIASLHEFERLGYKSEEKGPLKGFKAFEAALEDTLTSLEESSPELAGAIARELKNKSVVRKAAESIGTIDKEQAVVIGKLADELGADRIPIVGRAIGFITKLIDIQTLANAASGGKAQIDFFQKLGEMVQGSESTLKKLNDGLKEFGIDLSKEGISKVPGKVLNSVDSAMSAIKGNSVVQSAIQHVAGANLDVVSQKIAEVKNAFKDRTGGITRN